MATTILGLPSSAKFNAEGDRFLSHRRRILRYFPQGGAPLTGFLSLIEQEPLNDAIYIWYEDRYISPKTTARGTASLTTTAPSTGDADDGTTAGTGAKTITSDFYIKVASTIDLKRGSVIRFDTQGMTFIVTDVTRGAADPTLLGYVKARLLRAVTIANVSEFAAGTVIRVIGTAYGEGQAGAGLQATGFKRPIAIQNTTQIFRDHFDFPGSVLQMGLKYDRTGPYRKKAQDTLIDHMTGIERSLFWGKRHTATRPSHDSNQEDLTTRTFSGMLESLELWDAGSSGLSIDGATYAPYSMHGPATLDTDDNKRIIANADGLLTRARFNGYLERIGRYHHNRTNQKLVVCGSTALLAATEMFHKNAVFNVTKSDNVYGLTLLTYHSPFGDYHFMTHPLWNEDPILRTWMFFVDIWSWKLRPLNNRDTRLLKMRQNPSDDFRRDEYLTELGLECWQPEGNLLWKNVTAYSE